MKSNEQAFQTFDDILFENRNQTYGAYVIRRSYDRNVNRAVSIVFGAAIGITMLSMLLPYEQVVTPEPKPSPTKFERGITIIPEVQKRRARMQENIRRDLPPHVVSTTPDSTVSDVPVPNPGNDLGTSSDLPFEGNDFGAFIETPGTSGLPSIFEPPKIYDIVEVKPAYVGGLEAMTAFIKKHVKYPAIARLTGVDGTVYVQFVLSVDGRITQAKVIKGVSDECDKEALRVITMMPAWNPGLQGGVRVMVRMVLPIRFKLS